MQKRTEWSHEKNEWLKLKRDVCFEDVMTSIESGGQLDLLPHPNREKYPRQKILIVKIRGYVYAVPFVEDDEKRFLKTIFPDRDYTKKYLSDL